MVTIAPPSRIPQRLLLFASVFCMELASAGAAAEFRSAWPEDIERTWVGADCWANRLQDWRIADGRLECVEGKPGKPMRTVHLLTRRLKHKAGGFTLSVRLGLIDKEVGVSPQTAAGFLIGAAPTLDYRAAALVHHSAGPGGGLFAGIDGKGRLFINDFAQVPPKRRPGPYAGKTLARSETKEAIPSKVVLRLAAEPAGEKYLLKLTALDAEGTKALGTLLLKDVESKRLVGSIALVSHPGGGKPKTGRFWFRDWTVSGERIGVHEDRTCGPILSTQYTLSRGTLKMTAQMMPLGEADTQGVRLEIRKDGTWTPIAKTKMIVPGRTAPLRVDRWDATRDTPYRIAYDLRQPDGSTKTCTWSGTIRRDPLDKATITLAAFTGNHNVRHGGVDRGRFAWNESACWFPHNDIVDSVAKHKPDVLFFSGDQVYEGASPTRPEVGFLDYLYKWYLWCWAFRDLAKDRPCLCTPDDHDVYQGNIWGAGGRKARRQDDGGYTRPVEFVKMVERTQTSHFPDPFDPTPIAQGIGVYYCAMNWGKVSFAVVEDRKFKSSPTVMVPEGRIVNGWPQNPDFDAAKQSDVAGAKLLGQRQLDFLRAWSQDWSHHAAMKVALSQTLFSNVATLPRAAGSDKVVPKLNIVKPGEYPPNDHRVSDHDSNGWPQSGRNKAIRELRRGFALHVCGDQHLGSTVQYGVDDWQDASFAICTPSIANFFPRRWFPGTPGKNREPGAPKYTGDFLDGFGNHVTVHAVSNPVDTGREPRALHSKAPGYAVVNINTETREYTLANWPRWEDPSKPGANPYAGWPVKATQAENYGRKAAAYLPTIRVRGTTDPVIQVIDEGAGEVVYTLRIQGETYRPKVFKPGTYTIRIRQPDEGKRKELTGVKSMPAEESKTIEVSF